MLAQLERGLGARSRMWSAARFDTHGGSGPSPIDTLLYCWIVPFANSNDASADVVVGDRLRLGRDRRRQLLLHGQVC